MSNNCNNILQIINIIDYKIKHFDKKDYRRELLELHDDIVALKEYSKTDYADVGIRDSLIDTIKNQDWNELGIFIEQYKDAVRERDNSNQTKKD